MGSKNITEIIRADDFVEYFLFPSLDELLGNDIDEKLDRFLAEVNECVRAFTKDYIWHKEPFQLIASTVVPSKLFSEKENDDELPPHLHGLTFFGENIQDEWFITEIIFHLTTIYTHLIARIIDADGEFMLIEAAEVLPKWANPDTCINRVYVYNGDILLVQNSPSNTSTELPVPAALREIRQNTKNNGSEAITNCIKQRFSDLKQEPQFHRVTVYLPASAAWLLKNNPQFISAAVRAFYNRDSIDLKSCKAMKNFPPETRVYTQVTFTRCLYAMITHQNYMPDRRTGWNLPPMSDKTYRACSIGMKIACGLEILASKAQTSGDDLEKNKGWHVFLDRLKKNEYFGENIEHSKGYCLRLERAKEYFKMFADSQPTHTNSLANEILKQLRNFDSSHEQFNVDDMQTYEPNDDSENWLNISPEDLDNMLAQRYGMKKAIHSGENGDDLQQANDLTENLQTFLNSKSEFDGVDYRPIFTPRPPNKINQATSNDKTVDFNPDAFQNHLKEMLDFVLPDDQYNWDSHSDMSDYDDEAIDRNIEMMVNGNKAGTKTQLPSEASDIAAYMEQMDRELAATTIGKSFATKASINAEGCADDDDFDDIESFKPVDINVNALQNLAESYQAQLGSFGPASSLLGSLGIQFDVAQKQPADRKEAKPDS